MFTKATISGQVTVIKQGNSVKKVSFRVDAYGEEGETVLEGKLFEYWGQDAEAVMTDGVADGVKILERCRGLIETEYNGLLAAEAEKAAQSEEGQEIEETSLEVQDVGEGNGSGV